VYVNLGVACSRLGRLEDARVNLENAIRLSEETGQPRTLAHALLSLSETLVSIGDMVGAKERCYHALEVFTELNDRLGMSAAYADLGDLEMRADDSHASEECYRESLRAIEGLDAPRSMAQRRMELGLVLAESGNRDEAVEQLKLSLELFRSVEAEDMVERVTRELRALGSDQSLRIS